MKGIVKSMNPHRGFAAVELDTGYSVLEIFEVSTSLELGDVISGPLESLGGETVKNVSKNETYDVFIQDCHCSKEIAMQLMK